MSGIGNSYGFGGGLNGYGGGFGGGFGKGVNGFNSFDLSAYSLTGTKPAPNGPWGGKIGGGWSGKPGGPNEPHILFSGGNQAGGWGGKISGGIWGGKIGGPKQPIGKLPSPFPMPIVIPSKPKE
jgi:hypothetical protein